MPNRRSTRRHIRRSNLARLDLLEIWLFIAQDNPSAADRLLREIGKQTKMLAHTPRMGVERNEIKHGLHSFPIESYVIFYTIENDGITIARVLHSARDIKSIF